jgi:ATP-binding cassette, subfamily C, bacterial LapB
LNQYSKGMANNIPDNSQPTQPHDPYLAALEYLARYHGRSFSRADILQNLPISAGKLDAALFCRAAERVGLQAKVMVRQPSTVSGLVCPFIVPMKNGDVGVATEKRLRGKTRIVIPETPHVLNMAPADLDLHATGTVILVADTDREAFSGPQSAIPQKRGHWLWSVAARFWPTWLYVLFAALFINLLGLALPLFVMNVYDRVIPNYSISTLWALAIGVAIALVFDFILRMLRAVVIDHTGRRIDMNVSSSLFEQAMDASMASRPANTGEIASNIREFETVRDFFTSSGIASIIDLLFIGIFLGVLWLLVGPLVLVALIAVPLVLGVTLFIQIPLGRSVASAQKTITNRQSLLVEALTAIETVKAHSAEGVMQRKWENAVSGSVRASSAIRFWSSLAMYFSMFVQQSVSVVIIVWGVFLVAAGEITIGALIASNILAGRVLAPLSGIAMTLARAQQSFSALRQLNRLMKLDRDHAPLRHDAGSIQSGRLEIRNLGFAYSGQGPDALNGLTLSIAPGERVAIVGRVGSGKSTLGKVLCGLYRPVSGTVLIDNKELRHFQMAELRKALIYSGQDAELFSGTIRENILMARPVSKAWFEACAHAAGVAAIVKSNPMGYALQVGERGRALSGGQRQAIALARAMIAEPAIMFLDEPTSAMDNLSEAAFVSGFREWLPDSMTLIIATHRASLLALADRLIVMENGRVAADGPKDKVLAALKKGKLAGTVPAGDGNGW